LKKGKKKDDLKKAAPRSDFARGKKRDGLKHGFRGLFVRGDRQQEEGDRKAKKGLRRAQEKKARRKRGGPC